MTSFITTVLVNFSVNQYYFICTILGYRNPASCKSTFSQVFKYLIMSPNIDIHIFPKPPRATYTSPYLHGIHNSNQRTRNQFRPRNANKGTTSYQLRQYAEATLGGGSLRKIVKLPEGEDENEWLAVNSKTATIIVFILTNECLVVDFYNHINLLYGSITEFCSPQSCPEMKATDE